MRKEYDFSKGKKNPYAKQLKQQITIRLDKETIAYFKELASGLEVRTGGCLTSRCSRRPIGAILNLEGHTRVPEKN